ncbi:MAG: hypothetical protein AAFX85_13100 [Pseudomonadota bacterium]
MSATPIYAGQTFFAPTFQIKLKGQQLRDDVVRDVLQVSYTDDLENLDSFEFTLNDWDPVQRVPKYSSPFDEGGQPVTTIGNQAVANFEPGAIVELYMGYQGGEDPTLMMTGQIVSISPNFPASGNPTLRVRALNLLFTLQRGQEVVVYEDGETDSEIAEDIASRLGVEIEIPPGQQAQETPSTYVVINNQYPILFLARLARRRGYDLYVSLSQDGETSTLFFGRKANAETTYELEWGRSLVQFTPTLKTKGQVSRVTVRGWDPTQSGDDRTIEGEATLEDLGLEMPDAELLREIDSALAESYEEVVDQVIQSQEEADFLALGILRENVRGLITGRGSTVGFPALRAGRRVRLSGMGVRYSGDYMVTKTTHTIGASGYTTQFEARMEVLRD